jgi:hypothetical protein
MSPIFSYSKSKGAFAGISVEGSVLIERKDINCKFYGRDITAKEILTGVVEAPEKAAALYSALDVRVTAAGGSPGISNALTPNLSTSNYNGKIKLISQVQYNLSLL